MPSAFSLFAAFDADTLADIHATPDYCCYMRDADAAIDDRHSDAAAADAAMPC